MQYRVIRHSQAGFTLIELIITIVIIGILAAVAIPKFQDLTGDANTGVAKGAGAALASASSVNYARRAGNTGGQAVTNCTDLAALADVPAGFTIATGTLTAGVQGDCTINWTGGSYTFKAYGA